MECQLRNWLRQWSAMAAPGRQRHKNRVYRPNLATIASNSRVKARGRSIWGYFHV